MKTETGRAIRRSLKINRETALPFLLTGLIILADQAVKALIVLNWPREGTLIKDLFGNGVLQFYHVRNKAIAFSLGQNIPTFCGFPFSSFFRCLCWASWSGIILLLPNSVPYSAGPWRE
jgi:lipoprotein signal peptidase